MKKLLLIVLAVSFAYFGYSQATKVSDDLLNYSVKAKYEKPPKDIISFNLPVNPTTRSYSFIPDETIIGTTFYDLWSNTLIGNRIAMHPDGTMGAVWTRGLEATSFPDRGTGYNFYDGTAWGPEPTERIENIRTGWPSYDTWGPNGEINVAHNGSTGLEISTRENRGTGDWTQALYQGPAGIENDPTWPRVVTSGDNNEYIHLLYNSYNEYEGQPQAMLYSRSNDGGDTWDPQDLILDGTGSDSYTEIGADQYVMDSREETVVILSASAWHDMFYMISEDNGDTWEKNVVWEHPYPFYDEAVTLTDTFFCVDNSADIAIAPDGTIHIAFGINRVLNDEIGDGFFTLFPYIDGIGYWNSTMEPFSDDRDALAPPQYGYENTELIEDFNYIGYSQDVDGDDEITFVDDLKHYRELGISTMPAIACSEDGSVYVAFASTTETYDNIDFNYKKIWARAWVPVGGWGPFYHVTENIIHIFDESIYPTAAKTINDAFHIIYQADDTPGYALNDPPDHDYQENRIYHSAIPIVDLLTGLSEPVLIDQESVSQNYPNPFNEYSTVSVTLNESVALSLEVNNLIGKSIYKEERGTVNSGTYYFQIDASEFTPGIYFYTVRANESKVTKKMIIR